MPPPVRRAGLFWVTAVTLVALGILVGLGAWQWNRKAWKDEVIATITARITAAPIDAATFRDKACALVDAVGLAASCEYVPVRITGSYDHGRERHVFTTIARSGAGGGQGYWIMTPFRIAATGETVAVSRGFMPDTAMDKASRARTWTSGAITITGLIRSAETRQWFTNANNPATNTWYLRKPTELFSDLRDVPVTRPYLFIDLTSPTPATTGGLPQITAGSVNIPNRHLEYALTWWALAATLVGVSAAFVSSRLRAVKSP